jgi:hypothetical protein
MPKGCGDTSNSRKKRGKDLLTRSHGFLFFLANRFGYFGWEFESYYYLRSFGFISRENVQ